MGRLMQACTLIMTEALASGCVTPAPGAQQVTITRNPADVASCTPVGNIDTETMGNAQLNPVFAQNKAVGLNANVILDTGAGGVAYRCNTGTASRQ